MACANREAALRLCGEVWSRAFCDTARDDGRGAELEANEREMAGRVGVMRVYEAEMGALVTWLETYEIVSFDGLDRRALTSRKRERLRNWDDMRGIWWGGKIWSVEESHDDDEDVDAVTMKFQCLLCLSVCLFTWFVPIVLFASLCMHS